MIIIFIHNMKLLNIYKNIIRESDSRVEKLKSDLKAIGDWVYTHPMFSPGWSQELFDSKEQEAITIRRELKKLTGDYHGRSATERAPMTKPSGLNASYDHPEDVPLDVYRWINKRMSLLTSDATDAVRWSRIINTKDDPRYPSGEITIYRAVDDRRYDESGKATG